MTDTSQALRIEDVLVSEEVRRIQGERWSGVLALSQGEVSKGIYFLDGDVAFATSTLEEDRLGANLVRVGRITEAEFRAAMAVAQAPGQRLGQALMSTGVLSPAELAAAVTGQVERIVFSVLRWTRGEMRRRGMDRPIPADLLLDLSTPRILLLGARAFPDPGRLEAVLGGPATGLRRRGRPVFDYQGLEVSPPERAVLALCARETTLDDVLRLPHPRARLVRATYALVAGGVVEAKGRDREEARPPVAPSRVGTTTDPPLPPLEPEGTPEAAPAVEEASSATPSDPETGEQRARALLEQGDSERAVALLTELVKQHPESVACRRLLAMARANDLGADPAVEELFLNVLVAAPKDAELRYRLARYYLRAGSKARAMLQLRLVLSSDPGHAGAWRDLGELEAGEGQRGR